MPHKTALHARRPASTPPARRIRWKTLTSDKSPFLRQGLRIRKFQQRWKNIKDDLPPQLSRRHIGMISIGGVIGTGLLLGSADALHNGGPVGALLAYMLISSVVYCLCVSIGEMISFLPNVGGVVGFADLYVDRALGFSLGWASWYSWSVTLPAEISAAAVVVGFWDNEQLLPVPAVLGIMLATVLAINCLPSHVYGNLEFMFSSMKVGTIVFVLVLSLAIDCGAGQQGYIGFKNWSQPFSDSYNNITGDTGRFLGFWAVIMQAFFSFSGSEIAGIAAGEVIDATRNVPKALYSVWVTITFFYIGGIFFAGLLVPQDNPHLVANTGNATSSPFVIAAQLAGIKVVPHIINTAILMSAWSAAASDLYISSRFLFFLAKCHHAPEFLGYLIKYPYNLVQDVWNGIVDSDDEEASGSLTPETPPVMSRSNLTVSDTSIIESSYILPITSVLVSASVGLLSFLSYQTSAELAFKRLCAAASVGALQAWAGQLFTYIRWYQGVVYAEKKYSTDNTEQGRNIIKRLKKVREGMHWAQPYCAIYAFIMCILIILTNGWYVFAHGSWHIAQLSSQSAHAGGSNDQSDRVAKFLSSYLPIPCFLLLTFGYKIVHQTKMVSLEEMNFLYDAPADTKQHHTMQRHGWRRVLDWLGF